PMTLVMGQPISSEWLVALGCSLRGGISGVAAKEISFLGEELEDRFRMEELLRFLEFWRAVVPAALGVLIAAVLVANVFLVHAKDDIESDPGYTLLTSASAEVLHLIASSAEFNDEVAAIQAIESSGAPEEATMFDIQGLAASQGIEISRLTLGTPV